MAGIELIHINQNEWTEIQGFSRCKIILQILERRKEKLKDLINVHS